MSGKTKIEWSEATWNPIVGCSVVSPGCTNCYAMNWAGKAFDGNLDHKTGTLKYPHYQGTTKKVNSNYVWTGKVALAPEHILNAPLSWKKPRVIFVNSMGDLFHEDVPDGWILTVLDIIFRTPQHTYQILTKRAARMNSFMRKWCDLEGEAYDFVGARGPDATRAAHPSGRGQLFAAYLDTLLERSGGKVPDGAAWPTFDWAGGMIGWPNWPGNAWFGVSAEDQTRADERIPVLLDTPAAVRFVSAEPLLGPIIIPSAYLGQGDNDCYGNGRLDWVIVGGESGKDARPMKEEWARSIRDQCAAAGVPFFMKQMGGKKKPFPDIPSDLFIREYPEAT